MKATKNIAPNLLLELKAPSLWLRLVLFLTVFVAVMALALSIVFIGSGVFSAGIAESSLYLSNELEHVSTEIEQNFTKLSVECAVMASAFSERIVWGLSQNGAKPSELKGRPELIYDILRDSMAYLTSALEKNKASGIFLILDATVNPSAPGADSSRAGLFIRNTEPNALYYSKPSLHLMKGPVALAREAGMYILPQWEMEFDVTEGGFFYSTIEPASNSLDISRLYYLNPADRLSGDYDDAVLLSAPIIAPDGFIIGICGFEVNMHLFKTLYLPKQSSYKRIFAMLSPVSGTALNAGKALFASDYFPFPGLMSTLEKSKYKGSLSLFKSPDGYKYIGISQNIRLYPKGAAHIADEWAATVLVPEGDLKAYVSNKNASILFMLSLMFLVSIAFAIFLSSRYLAPLKGALNQIKASKYSKTNIREIDDLFSFLASQDEERERALKEASETEAKKPITKKPQPELVIISGDAVPENRDEEAEEGFQEFIIRLNTLSKAERSVFNLYARGYVAKEVSEILYISENTVKTHNSRIYSKLNVTSLRELKAYLRTMREKGYQIAVPVET